MMRVSFSRILLAMQGATRSEKSAAGSGGTNFPQLTREGEAAST